MASPACRSVGIGSKGECCGPCAYVAAGLVRRSVLSAPRTRRKIPRRENVGDHRRDRATHAFLPHRIHENERDHQQMGQRQPHGAQLQQTGGPRVEHSTRDIDVCDRVAVEKKVAVLKVVKKENRDTRAAMPATRAALVSERRWLHAVFVAVFVTQSALTGINRGLSDGLIPNASVRGISESARRFLHA